MYIITYIYIYIDVIIYLFLYVCVCACMHVCMHASMHGWMDGCIDVQEYPNTFLPCTVNSALPPSSPQPGGVALQRRKARRGGAGREGLEVLVDAHVGLRGNSSPPNKGLETSFGTSKTVHENCKETKNLSLATI